MRQIKEIIIHHSASSINTTVEQINDWHKERNFSSYMKRGKKYHIGYHYIIDWKGVIHRCRPLWQMGCHSAGHNLYSIGICITGNFEKILIDNERYIKLITLCYGLFLTFGKLKIKGHRDYAPTNQCPGENLYNFLPDLRDRAKWHFENSFVDCGTPLMGKT